MYTAHLAPFSPNFETDKEGVERRLNGCEKRAGGVVVMYTSYHSIYECLSRHQLGDVKYLLTGAGIPGYKMWKLFDYSLRGKYLIWW